MRRRGCIIASIVAGILAILCLLFLIWLSGLSNQVMSQAGDPTGASPSPATNVSDPPDEVIYCDVLKDCIRRDQCDHYTEIWNKLEVGTGGVEMPDKVIRGEPATVSFALTTAADDADSALEDALGSEPDKKVSLKVGRRMAAKLEGDGFTVEPAGLQQRDLFLSDSTRWDWRVTAQRASRHRLVLTAYVVVPADDGSAKENLLKTLELPLPVEITWGQRFGDLLDDSSDWLTRGTNWLTVLAGFLAALVAVLGYLKLKKPKESDPPAA